MRRLVTEALVDQTTPDALTAALIGLLHALGCERKVVDLGADHLTQQQLTMRAEEIETGDWAIPTRSLRDDPRAARRRRLHRGDVCRRAARRADARRRY